MRNNSIYRISFYPPYFIFKSANKSVDKSILNGRGTYNIYKIKLYSKYKDISTSFNADYH